MTMQDRTDVSPSQEWRLHHGEGRVPDWFIAFCNRYAKAVREERNEEWKTELSKLPRRGTVIVGEENGTLIKSYTVALSDIDRMAI